MIAHSGSDLTSVWDTKFGLRSHKQRLVFLLTENQTRLWRPPLATICLQIKRLACAGLEVGRVSVALASRSTGVCVNMQSVYAYTSVFNVPRATGCKLFWGRCCACAWSQRRRARQGQPQHWSNDATRSCLAELCAGVFACLSSVNREYRSTGGARARVLHKHRYTHRRGQPAPEAPPPSLSMCILTKQGSCPPSARLSKGPGRQVGTREKPQTDYVYKMSF